MRKDSYNAGIRAIGAGYIGMAAPAIVSIVSAAADGALGKNHFACTWRQEPPRFTVFRNGKKIAELTEPAPQRSGDGILSLGPLDATYDEFRLSRVVRYDGEFTPHTRPFVEDRDTVLLFHFDQNLRGAGKGRGIEFARD